MPKIVKPLSEAEIRALKPKEKTGKPSKSLYLPDGGGLYFVLDFRGTRRWIWKYRFNGKPGMLGLGVYPETTLARARELRAEFKKLLAEGINPSDQRKAEKEIKTGANTFATKALGWFHAKKAPECAPGHAAHIKSYLDRDVLPWLGKKLITEISPDDLLSVARRVEDRGAIATAHRVIGVCSEIFCYALGKRSDPTIDMRDKLRKKPKAQHRAALCDESGHTDPARVASVLRMFDGYQGGFIVRCALLFGPLTFARPGELRKAEWKDIDLAGCEWHYLATKKDVQHIVPLSRQALEILKAIHPLTGHGRYVFPNPRSPDGSRPMSENAVLAAYRSLGIPQEDLCGHGWRSIARTLLDEKLGYRVAVIEKQSGRAVQDPNGEAYNRTHFLEERRKMMQVWADYLDGLRAGETVLTFRNDV